MIFVTVGTYERPFDKLVIDILKAEGVIRDDEFRQIGYFKYLPQSCDYINFVAYQDLKI